MPSEDSTKRRRGRATEAAAADPDALISLPPDALDEILTRLGIRDAVRTSVLSHAWRHRWEALPSLDLCFPRPEDDDSAPEELGVVDGEGAPEGLGAVDGILLRFPGRIRRFCAHLDVTYAGRIHDWLCVLSRRGVEVLDLSFSGGFPALPSSVFSCVRLTELSLSGCTIPLLPPGFVAFPELSSLTLKNVRLQDHGEDQLEEIIDTSPLLEYLELTDVFFNGANVREWSSDMMPEILLCTFHNLKSLKLFTHFCKQPPVLLTLCLLKSAPNLEKLKIEIFEGGQEVEANGEFLNALWTDGMCANLQLVQLNGINWRPNEMSFVELILSKARLLHTLSISHGVKIVMPNEDALNELLTYKRASAEAQVLFKGKAEGY